MTRVSSTNHESLGLPKSVVGWIVNHATSNYWRVADWYELDDLIQDGLVKAYQCQQKYGADQDPPLFMAQVKKAFYRHITDLLRDSRPEQACTSRVGDVAGELDETAYLDRHAPSVDGDFDLAALIAEMPPSLRKACALMVDRTKHPRVHLELEDETESHWLKRLAGFPLRHDFETVLRDYLSASQAA